MLLSDDDWAAISPSWDAPYDSSDLREVRQRLRDLPAFRARRLRELRDDVERLRKQFPVSFPQDPPWYSMIIGACNLFELGRMVSEGTGNGDLFRADDAGSSELLRAYVGLGLHIHMLVAADWLADKYGLGASAALQLLEGGLTPEEAVTWKENRSVRSLPLIGHLYRKGLRQGEAAFKKGVARGLREASQRRLTLTDCLLLHIDSPQTSPSGRGRGWTDAWEYYERLRADWLGDPEAAALGTPRSFGNWRSFAMASRRAHQRKRRSEEREHD